MSLSIDMYPQSTDEIQVRRHTLASRQTTVFHEFSRRPFRDEAAGANIEQLIAAGMCAGTPFAHSTIALDAVQHSDEGER